MIHFSPWNVASPPNPCSLKNLNKVQVRLVIQRSSQEDGHLISGRQARVMKGFAGRCRQAPLRLSSPEVLKDNRQ